MNKEYLIKFLPENLRYKLTDFRGRGEYSYFANQYQTIFIHIPKTGGSSIAKSLFNKNSRHVPWFEYYKTNRKKFNKFFKFALVRNPWDRLVSSYLYLKGGGMNQMDKNWALENLNQFSTFEEFVLNWVNEKNINSWLHFKPQKYWICDKNNNIMVDYLGRLETINRDFLFIRNKIGVKNELIKINSSKRDRYDKYYNDATIEIVNKIYNDDIKLFGYDYDET